VAAAEAGSGTISRMAEVVHPVAAALAPISTEVCPVAAVEPRLAAKVSQEETASRQAVAKLAVVEEPPSPVAPVPRQQEEREEMAGLRVSPEKR
jgi:hypothetical protein